MERILETMDPVQIISTLMRIVGSNDPTVIIKPYPVFKEIIHGEAQQHPREDPTHDFRTSHGREVRSFSFLLLQAPSMPFSLLQKLHPRGHPSSEYGFADGTPSLQSPSTEVVFSLVFAPSLCGVVLSSWFVLSLISDAGPCIGVREEDIFLDTGSEGGCHGY